MVFKDIFVGLFPGRREQKNPDVDESWTLMRAMAGGLDHAHFMSHSTARHSSAAFVEELLPEVNLILKEYSKQGKNSGSLYVYPGCKPGKLTVSAKPPPISHHRVGKVDLYAGSTLCLARGKPAHVVQDKAKDLQSALVAAGYSARSSSSSTCPDEAKRWNNFCHVTNSIDGERLKCSAYWSPELNWRLTKPDQKHAGGKEVNPIYKYKYGSEKCMPGYVKLDVSWTFSKF